MRKIELCNSTSFRVLFFLLSLSFLSAPMLAQDMDKDGVLNVDDLDKDNDGILDSNEGYLPCDPILNYGWSGTVDGFRDRSTSDTLNYTYPHY